MPAPTYLQNDKDRISGGARAYTGGLLPGNPEHEEMENEFFFDALDELPDLDDEPYLDAPEAPDPVGAVGMENRAATRMLSRLLYNVVLRIAGQLLARYAGVVDAYRKLQRIYDDSAKSQDKKLTEIAEVVRTHADVLPERLRTTATTAAQRLESVGEILKQYQYISGIYGELKAAYDGPLSAAQKLPVLLDLLRREDQHLPESLRAVTAIASGLERACSALRPEAGDNGAAALTRIADAIKHISSTIDNPRARSILPEGAVPRLRSMLQPVRLMLDQITALTSLSADSGFADYLTALLDRSGPDSWLPDMLGSLLPLTEQIRSELPELASTYPVSGSPGEQLSWLIGVLADGSHLGALMSGSAGGWAASLREGFALVEQARTFPAGASVGQQAAWMVQQMSLPSTQALLEQSGAQPVMESFKRQLGLDPSSVDLMNVLVQITDAGRSPWQKAWSLIALLMPADRIKHALRPVLAQAVAPVLALLPGGNLFSSAWEWYQRMPPSQDWSTALEQFATTAWGGIKDNPALLTDMLPGGGVIGPVIVMAGTVLRYPSEGSWEDVLNWAVTEAQQNPAMQWYYNRYVELCLGWAIYEALQLSDPLEQERQLQSLTERLNATVAPLGLPGVDTVIGLLPLLPALLAVRKTVSRMPQTDSWIDWASELVGVLEHSTEPAWQNVKERLQTQIEQRVSDALVSGLDSLPALAQGIYSRLPAVSDPLKFPAAEAGTIPPEYTAQREQEEAKLAAVRDAVLGGTGSTPVGSTAEAVTAATTGMTAETTAEKITGTTEGATTGTITGMPTSEVPAFEDRSDESIDDFLIELSPEDVDFLEKKTTGSILERIKHTGQTGALAGGVGLGIWWLATLYAAYRAARPATRIDSRPEAEEIELVVMSTDAARSNLESMTPDAETEKLVPASTLDNAVGLDQESLKKNHSDHAETDQLVPPVEPARVGSGGILSATTSAGTRPEQKTQLLKKYREPLIMAAVGAVATTLYGYLLLKDDGTPSGIDVTDEHIREIVTWVSDEVADSGISDEAEHVRGRRAVGRNPLSGLPDLKDWIGKNWAPEGAANPPVNDLFIEWKNDVYKNKKGELFLKVENAFWKAEKPFDSYYSLIIENKKGSLKKSADTLIMITFVGNSWKVTNTKRRFIESIRPKSKVSPSTTSTTSTTTTTSTTSATTSAHRDLARNDIVENIFDYKRYSATFANALKACIKEIFRREKNIAYSKILEIMEGTLGILFRDYYKKTEGPEVKEILMAISEVIVKKRTIKNVNNNVNEMVDLWSRRNLAYDDVLMREYGDSFSYKRVNNAEFLEALQREGQYEKVVRERSALTSESKVAQEMIDIIESSLKGLDQDNKNPDSEEISHLRKILEELIIKKNTIILELKGSAASERRMRLYKEGIKRAKEEISKFRKFTANQKNEALGSDMEHHFLLIKLALEHLKIKNNFGPAGYSPEDVDKLVELDAAKKYVDESMAMARSYYRLLPHLDFHRIRSKPSKKDYRDIIAAKEEAARIYMNISGSSQVLGPGETYLGKYNSVSSQMDVDERKLTFIASVVYWIIKNPQKNDLPIPFETVVDDFEKDMVVMSSQLTIPNKPLNYIGLMDFKKSTDFLVDGLFQKQFSDYLKEFSAYEARKSTVDLIKRSGLNIFQLFNPPKRMHRFQFYDPVAQMPRPGEIVFLELYDESWIVMHYGPNFTYLKQFSKAEMDRDCYLSTIKNGSWRKGWHVSKDTTMGFLNCSGQKTYLGESLEGQAERIKREFVGPVFGKDSALFLDKKRMYFLKKGNDSEMSDSNLISEIEKFIKNSQDEFALIFKAGLYKPGVWQRMALAFLPFYSEIYNAIYDELHEPNVAGIIVDCVNVAFVLGGTGISLTGKAAKFMVRSVVTYRNAGMPWRVIAKNVSKDLATQNFISAKDAAKIVAEGLWDLVEPIPVKDLLKDMALSGPLRTLFKAGKNADFGFDQLSAAWSAKNYANYQAITGSVWDRFNNIYYVASEEGGQDPSSYRGYYVKGGNSYYRVVWDQYRDTWVIPPPEGEERERKGITLTRDQDGHWRLDMGD